MHKLFVFLLLTLTASPALAQLRATESTSGGIASSATYTARLTVGEPIPGAVTVFSSSSDTLYTGFYFQKVLIVNPCNPDIQGPSVLLNGLGDTTFEPTSVPPSFIQPESEALSISAQITDQPCGASTAFLFYRQGGASSFTSVEMTPSGDDFSANVEGTNLTSRGLEYYIEARDALDNTTRNPNSGTHAVQVSIASPGLSSSFMGDTTQAGYRLIAVPMDLNNPQSSSVLAALGDYDIKQWRFWELKSNYTEFTGDDQYTELVRGTAFVPGKGYWLISRKDWEIKTEAATSILTNEPYTIALNPGWNFIGNPFNFPIPESNLSLSTGATPDLYTFSAGWQNATQMTAFQGFTIDAGDGDNVVLTINPSATSVASKDTPVAESPRSSTSSFDWAIQIMAESGDYTDYENVAAVSRMAEMGLDRLDRPEQPVIGDYVSVSFPHDEWGYIHRRFSSDVRPIPVDGSTWQFDVVTGTPRPVTLRFDGLDDVPPQFSIQLVDNQMKTLQDLRLRSTYRLQTSQANAAYPLSLIIGTTDYLDDESASHDLTPERYELDQNYPNPFNPTTSIRYGISSSAVVTLEVYNILGQVVRTLVNGQQQNAGYHVAVWDAHADDGSAVASGLYLYKLTVQPTDGATTTTTLTRKMMFIK